MYLSLLKFFVIINSTLGGFIQHPSLRLYKRQSSINLFNDIKNKSQIYKISFNNPMDDDDKNKSIFYNLMDDNNDILIKFRIYTGLNIILFMYYLYISNIDLMNFIK